MTNIDRVCDALVRAGAPLCDDCTSEVAEVYPRQQVYEIATGLAWQGIVDRAFGRKCGRCGKAKKTSLLLHSDDVSMGVPAALPALTNPEPPVRAGQTHVAVRASNDPESGWSWEGSVQGALRSYLVDCGWTVVAEADTATKQPGPDLHCSRGPDALVIEVKGYPTDTYVSGPKKGQRKPTQPASQARQWFSHALLSAMQLRSKFPSAETALCFPDYPTYRNLVESTHESLRQLGVGLFFVQADGTVDVSIPTARRWR